MGRRSRRDPAPGIGAHLALLLPGAAAAVALAGCFGATVPVPVAEQTTTREAVRVSGREHVVRRGDTLYSIAWAAGLDYRRLARWNGISPPYLIRPGETLRLTRPPPDKRPPAPTKAPLTRPPRAAKPAAPQPKRSVPVKGWAWPAEGKVTAGFAATGNKGIDIQGRTGEPVRSAASGRVVYAGSGLRGYGKLIIVKHNENFLSAYAHNRKLLVAEGNQVTRGQAIAEMGRTGTNRVKLHFEIRRRGTPVDPLRYLPKR